MKQQHTPAPWSTSGTDIWGPHRIPGDGYQELIAHVCNISKKKEREMNAHLIASAPDLLEACELALLTFKNMKLNAHAEKMKIAIAKAKGK